MNCSYPFVALAASLLLTRCGGNPGAGNDAGNVGDAATEDGTVPGDGGGATDSGATADRADVVSPSDGGTPDAGTSDAGSAGGTLAAAHPCDRGLATDPAVIWAEDFEEGSVDAVTARYDSANHPAGMSLVSDTPGACGGAALRLVSNATDNATDLYKVFPDQDEVYVRWYAKYQPNVTWHHTGMWIGGYNPPTPWPQGIAGYRPNGDDHFSIAVEPAWNVGQSGMRLDTYDYWMGMHSWAEPPPDTNAYYGNSTIHRQSLTADDGNWVCLELHVKLNTDVTSSAGAEFDLWKNDVLVQHFDAQNPVGCWIRDKFCPQGADGPECTDYPDLCQQPYVPLDQQWRSTSALRINTFWPQNYITEGGDGALQLDQMVIATQRVGCLR